jgi:exodeoxyribonuclease V alpha subunit
VSTSDERAAAERLRGIVERVTFHNPQTGWSVLQVSPFGAPQTRVSVLVHQAHVVPGASMEFHGNWQTHPRYGEQFRSTRALERKPASAAALERYLGSGLIRGVGPRTARKIVAHFGNETLEVFEGDALRLLEVRGIARRKLETITSAWREHRALRDVMMFLQEHDLSSLFAVRIYKLYGDTAVDIVRRDPFRLARDVYGIGFFSADRVATSLGFDPRGAPRLEAGIRHVLSASREEGHCFLTATQVERRVRDLLGIERSGRGGSGGSRSSRAEDEAADARDPEVARTAESERAASDRLTATAERETNGAAERVPEAERIRATLADLAARGEVRMEALPRATLPPSARDDAPPAHEGSSAAPVPCYYARGLFRDEATVARQVARRIETRVDLDVGRVARWLAAWSRRTGIELSEGQTAAVLGIATQQFSILTGGPGCGKTTTTRALVGLAHAMGRRVVLAAPTGRAAQRMGEVVGRDARTIHRLLEWSPVAGGFSRNAERPIAADVLVVDETSMLDVTLAACLLEAVPLAAQIVLVGDPHQLPSVGAGAVLADLLRTDDVPRFELVQIFRQAEASRIVRFAHAIHRGEVPPIPSPFSRPNAWGEAGECLFLDGEEATQEEIRFVRRARSVIERTRGDARSRQLVSRAEVVGRLRPSDGPAGIEVVRTGPRGGGGNVEMLGAGPEGEGVRGIEGMSGGQESDGHGTEGVAADPDHEQGDGRGGEPTESGRAVEDAAPEPFVIPPRFLRVDLERLAQSESGLASLCEVMGRMHPQSVLQHGYTLVDAIQRLFTRTIPERLGPDCEVQILTPMNRGSLGAAALNRAIQERVRPARPGLPELQLGERILRVGDRVIQRRNDYELGVFNGDIGRIVAVDPFASTCEVEFGSGTDTRTVPYTQADLVQLALAYAITVHKSQGSEFDAVILPLGAQHHRMLFRALVYTALTRARRLAVFVGERRALALAVRRSEGAARQTALAHRIAGLLAPPVPARDRSVRIAADGERRTERAPHT